MQNHHQLTERTVSRRDSPTIAVRRFGIQSRRPRALPFDLVDCPPCTFVDRKRKRQPRGRRHYIHGSQSLPRSESVGRRCPSQPASPQAPVSDAIAAQGAHAETSTYDMVSWEPRSGKIGNIERRNRIVDADDYAQTRQEDIRPSPLLPKARAVMVAPPVVGGRVARGLAEHLGEVALA